jgi:hypothetical protein
MDKIEKYRQIVKETLLELTKGSYAPVDLKNFEIFDDKTGRYIIVNTGYEEDDILTPKMNDILTFIELTSEGKVILKGDRSDDEVYDNLIENGIDKSDIISNLYKQ